MELRQTMDRYYLSIKDSDGKVRNQQILIVASSGHGKGLASEAIIEEFHRAGYVILNLADHKDQFELAYAMFKPKEKYHLRNLRIVGKRAETKKVKLYHPFTFRIPTKEKLPDIQFFTFSLKELGNSEWSMLAETSFETDTIRLLKNATQNIGKDDGLYGFLHYVRDIIRGKVEKRKVRYDRKNFFLDVTQGTAKSIQDISAYLQPFRTDYFLSKESSNLKLNWKEILADQQSYHIFSSKWIRDPKLKSFVILALLSKIIENSDYTRHPVLIYIPEVRVLTPYKPEGYKKFLAMEIKDKLSTIRNMGRGMSSLLDAQVYSGIDEDVRDSATTLLLGELGGVDDIKKISQDLSYKREIKDKLSRMPKNNYMIKGKEQTDLWKFYFPAHCHCEPEYNFIEMYRDNFPERMKNYSALVKQMKEELKKEEQRFEDLIKKREKAEKERREREKAEKEAQSGLAKEIEETKKKYAQVKDKSRIEKMKLVYNAFKENPEISYRELGKRFGISHTMIARYIRDYEKILREEDKIDYEDKTLLEISSQD